MHTAKQRAREMRLMITGGGTAGHVYPALAVYEALSHLTPRLRACWVGSERVESRIVPAAGVEFRHIDIRFSYKPLRLSNLHYYWRHILPIIGGKPFRQALAVVDAWRPEIVLSTGGYVAAPLTWAAIHRGIPVALLEINSPPGIVTWYFSDSAWRVYAASDGIANEFHGRCAQAKLKVLGYPARRPQRLKNRVYHDYDIDPRRRILLAMGGSLGAGAIHRAVRELLAAAAESGDPCWQKLAILNVAGERQNLRDALAGGDVLPQSPIAYYTVDFLDDAVGALAASDFYLGRSGAATVGELLACGLPALLIPDPQHRDQQQYGNARVLVDSGQGALIEQHQVTGATLLSWLRGVWDKPRYAPPDPPAADAVANDLLRAWEEL
jgi:UDP-N-acetylglucosamine--N-acetylmuramyl-(pentapeptide) pyrophosphoryl-undecaprenol N-acetylglucosamine transferase